MDHLINFLVFVIYTGLSEVPGDVVGPHDGLECNKIVHSGLLI